MQNPTWPVCEVFICPHAGLKSLLETQVATEANQKAGTWLKAPCHTVTSRHDHDSSNKHHVVINMKLGTKT